MSLISESKRALEALSDEQEYRLLFAATFAVFLVGIVVIRLLRSLHGASRPVERRISLFAEAKATVNSCLAFGFMG